MMFMKDIKHKNHLIAVFSILLILGIASLVMPDTDTTPADRNTSNIQNQENVPGQQNPNGSNPDNTTPADVVPVRTSLSGTYVCLPHRNTSGPQTMECAFGIRTDDGKHYGIDFNLMSQTKPENIEMGSRITANGLMTPVEMLSSDRWTTVYNIVGIFSVTDSLVITKQ
jgi:hypothetical protein